MKLNYLSLKRSYQLLLILFALFFVFLVACQEPPKTSYRNFNGEGIGTFYQISLRDSIERDLHTSVDSILTVMNHLFSLFSKESVITLFNQSVTGIANDEFAILTREAQRFSELTNRAFDPTIAPLVRLWGFGLDAPQYPDSATVTSLVSSIGMQYVRVSRDSVLKELPTISLDYNGIAKGYTVDKIARYLEQVGIRHYMINIGGEIRAKGLNSRGEAWIFGIETPEQGNLLGSSIVQRIQLSSCALATSGNYRSFREAGTRKWGHTINPHTGYPEENSLLSATVLAPTCTEADALATAMMVMGIDSARRFVDRIPEVEAILIARGDSTTYEVWNSQGMQKFLLYKK